MILGYPAPKGGRCHGSDTDTRRKRGVQMWKRTAGRVALVGARMAIGGWGLWALCTLGLAHAQGEGTPGKAEPLRLCYERADIRPWRRTDDTGLNFDLIRMAAARAKVPVAFVNLPWKRCLAQLQANEVQGLFAASFQPDRMAVGAYPGGAKPDATRRLHVDRYVLVRRKGDDVEWDGKSLSRLQGPVGAQLGYSVVRLLQGLGVAVDDGSQTAPELLKKLLAGRVGAAALGGSDAAVYLAEGSAFAGQLEALPQALEEKPYYLLLSHQLLREQPDTAERLWAGLAQARQTPDYHKLERAAFAALAPAAPGR